MLPGKTFGITVSLGNDWNENQAFQFAFQAFVNNMVLE